MIIPGYDEAMLVAFNGDNQGSYQPGWLQTIFNAAQSFFPNAKVEASTFDAFIEGAARFVATQPDSLPLLEMEIGDTWIYGCASDPKKLAMMRVIERERTICEASGVCDVNEKRYYDFSRLFLFNSEHTWGADTKTFLHDTENWSNVRIAREIVTDRRRFIGVLRRNDRTFWIRSERGESSDTGDSTLRSAL